MFWERKLKTLIELSCQMESQEARLNQGLGSNDIREGLSYEIGEKSKNKEWTTEYERKVEEEIEPVYTREIQKRWVNHRPESLG